MNRILTLSAEDIASDPERASELLNSACAHVRKMKLVGCCQLDDIVIVTFEETSKRTKLRHVFARFPDASEHKVIDEINSRYLFGFSAVGSFRHKDELWGLFSFDSKAKSVS